MADPSSFRQGWATRREHNNFIHIGAAKSFVKRIGVGLGGKFGTFQDGTPLAKDMTASLTLIPIAWVQAAIIVDNILSEDVGKRLGWEREFILGTKVNLMKLILVYADPHWAPDLDEGAWGFEGGLELALFSDFFLRGGLFRSAHVPFLNGRGSGYGFGAGWMAPRLAVDYAFSSAASGVIGTSHAFGLPPILGPPRSFSGGCVKQWGKCAINDASPEKTVGVLKAGNN